MKARVLILALILASGLLAACGGGDDGVGNATPGVETAEDDPEAVELARKVAEAIKQPAMVYHLVGDDGSEVWADAGAARFRRRDADLSGGLTAVGDGWTRFYYDPRSNETAEESLAPTGSQRPRIDDPMISWIEPLSALAFGGELRYEGETESEGRRVLVLTARSPVVSQGTLTGYLEGRIEVDPVTYLPVAMERRQVTTSGEVVTPDPASGGLDTNQRITFRTSELLPRDSVPADLFDRAAVEAQVQTLESEIARIRSAGLAPYWLGQDFTSDRGFLSLPERQGVSASAAAGEGEFQYALIIPTSPTSGEPALASVVVRLGADPAAFGPPPIQQFGGTLPERSQEVTVRGVPAIVYTSVLTPSDLPCEGGGCVNTDAPLFTRILFMEGATAVQIETAARVDANGQDRNGYNSVDGIVALAEALTEAP